MSTLLHAKTENVFDGFKNGTVIKILLYPVTSLVDFITCRFPVKVFLQPFFCFALVRVLCCMP